MVNVQEQQESLQPHHSHESKTGTISLSFSKLVKRIAKTKDRSDEKAKDDNERKHRGHSQGGSSSNDGSRSDEQKTRVRQESVSVKAKERHTHAQGLSEDSARSLSHNGIIIDNNPNLHHIHSSELFISSSSNAKDGEIDETFTWSRRVDYLLKAYGIPDLTSTINPDSQRHVSTLTKIGHSDKYGVVALKSLPQKWDDDAERLLQAIATWSTTLSHPNVQRLFGLSKPRLNTRLVAPWMVNGNVFDYLQKHRDVPPLRTARGIADGLAYLHARDPPVTHGNLKSSNILVSDKGEPVISDLDLYLIHRELDHGGSSAKNARSDAMSVRNPWGLAPELLFEDAPPDPKSDVYAFGMVILEITALTEPFSEIAPLNSARLIVHVYGGGRPARPTSPEAIKRGLSDDLWLLLERCWARSASSRPSASELTNILGALASKDEDGVQKMHDALMERIPDVTRNISLVDGMPVVGGGSFGDIRVANLEGIGKVVLKSLRPGSWAPPTRLTKRFIREASVWSTLDNPNVLPFLGIAEPPGIGVCLVSPWMENGNAFDYLEKRRNVTPYKIAEGIVQGLSYLHGHDPQVIHGDLRSANVVISPTGDALICDFGLAIIVEDLDALPISTSLKGEGNPRWMAPELLVKGEQPSAMSDVYALGMVFLELFTLAEPFAEYKRAPQVVMHVYSGGRPRRPTSDVVVERGLNDAFWQLMEECWREEASTRPNAVQVKERLLEFMPKS